MNTTRTPKTARTAFAAIALAGAGIIGVGAAASAYGGGDDEPEVEETSDDATSDDAVETSTDAIETSTDADDSDADAQAFAAAGEDGDDADGDDADGERRGNRGFRSAEAVAEVLGLTTDELRERRGEGLSIAAIAEQQGVAVDAVVEAIVDDAEQRIADKVAAGDLSQAEADEKLAALDERALDRVERTPGEGCDDGDDAEAAETTDA